jgi:hypothetical protein
VLDWKHLLSVLVEAHGWKFRLVEVEDRSY